MSDQAKIIEKIRKLLAMAGDTSSPNEALLAAKRARILMDQHQISKADVELSYDDGFKETLAARKGKTLPEWVARLASTAAVLNDCRSIVKTVRGRGGKISSITPAFQGFTADAVVAKMTMDYLVEACERFLEYSSVTGRSGYHFFRVGFAEAVQARCYEIAKERKVNIVTGSGTALVPLKMNMIASHFGDLKSRDSSPSRAPCSDEIKAYAAGLEAGKEVGLDNQVEGQESVKIGG